MPNKGKPLTWRPKGVSDALDGTNAFPGAMAQLANLIPDPTTASVFVPRPAALRVTDLSVFPRSPGAISVFMILNDVVYGMFASAEFLGFDQPFAFSLDTNAFLPVTGISTSNIPISPPQSGNWVPPVMDTLSTFILVAHPGFTGAANGFIGWFDITEPLAPVWHSGNVAVNPLIAPPVAVKVFGGRAYYAVGNATQASDALIPLTTTNAGQVLTYGDSTPITALGALPLNNQLGGIIQGLIVFKGVSTMYQLTGDFANMTWAINTLNVATGTEAPNTICPTSYGLVFVAPDGVRLINFVATVSDPIGHDGSGVTRPFRNAEFPSRMAAAFNQNVLRIAVQEGDIAESAPVEYWFDFSLKIWTGPHSFPTGLIQPWRNTFIVTNTLIGA